MTAPANEPSTPSKEEVERIKRHEAYVKRMQDPIELEKHRRNSREAMMRHNAKPGQREKNKARTLAWQRANPERVKRMSMRAFFNGRIKMLEGKLAEAGDSVRAAVYQQRLDHARKRLEEFQEPAGGD